MHASDISGELITFVDLLISSLKVSIVIVCELHAVWPYYMKCEKMNLKEIVVWFILETMKILNLRDR